MLKELSGHAANLSAQATGLRFYLLGPLRIERDAQPIHPMALGFTATKKGKLHYLALKLQNTSSLLTTTACR